MVAWFKWLLKSDIGTILQHRPTAFALVLTSGVLAIIISSGGKNISVPLLLYSCYILFPVLIFLMYVLLKKPIKVFLASIPGLVLGSLVVVVAAHHREANPDIERYMYSLLIFPFGFVLGATLVAIILLIWYFWKVGDLWLKAIGIPLLLILLCPYIVMIFVDPYISMMFVNYALLLYILCFFIILVYFTAIKLVKRFSL